MQRLLFVSFLVTALNSCGQTPEKTTYSLQVGDIYFDAKLDDPNFKLCDEDRVLQYYNFGKGVQYKGEKIKINQHFETGLIVNEKVKESGFLVIRFIVNCEGRTGRFRIQGMDNEYNEKTFNESLTNQLMSLTKTLDGWVTGEYDGKTYDYYQYLTFKMENGILIEIMP